jgi:phage tail-like protein
MAGTYPFRNFRFRVEIEGITRAGFSEVSGFDLNVDVVEYREGDDLRNTPRKLPGLTKYGNITFKWGVVADMEMMDWIYSVAASDQAPPTGIQRKNITITLYTDAGEDGPQWQVINAWPCRYSIPDLNAQGSEVAIESLEIAHEGLTRISAGEAGEPSAV